MRIGIYVGSFNPVHKGHIKVANHLIDNDYVDKILIIPTGTYWDKTSLIDIKDRINMLKIYENNKITIDEKLNNLPYTYMILEKLRERTNDEYYLIIGADNIIEFKKWKKYQKILENKILVLPRNNINIDEYLKEYNTKNFIVVKDFKEQNISSSQIRDNINNKEIIPNYLDESVLNYIIDHNLY